MDVDGGDGAAPVAKRVHSSKSRCVEVEISCRCQNGRHQGLSTD